jgi:hypothetical protein
MKAQFLALLSGGDRRGIADEQSPKKALQARARAIRARLAAQP